MDTSLIIPVYQDGNRFYNDRTNELIFVAPRKVNDMDMKTSALARLDFKEWCKENGVEYSFFP